MIRLFNSFSASLLYDKIILLYLGESVLILLSLLIVRNSLKSSMSWSIYFIIWVSFIVEQEHRSVVQAVYLILNSFGQQDFEMYLIVKLPS